MQSNRSHHKKINENRGSTLIEVMISLLVFAFLTIIFASAVITTKASSKMNGQYAQATSLCQHKIDQLRAVGFGRLSYEELSDAGIIDDDPTSSPYEFDEVDNVAHYLAAPTATLTTTIVPNTNDMVMRVRVSVTWKAAPNRARRSATNLDAYIVNVE